METNFCNEHTQMREDIGSIKQSVKNIEAGILRLDTRINGAFDVVGEHIKEAPEYRSRIIALETDFKLTKEDILCKFKDARTERFNTTKNAQWRIGIIVALISIISHIILTLWIK